MTLSFSKKSVEEAGDDWDEISELNTALQHLAARRKLQVDPTDDKIWPSKVAWKIEIFTQVVLHRVVALCEGTVSAWEAGQPLASVLSARAVMESAAFLWDFTRQLEVLCTQEDFRGIDHLANKRTFAAKDPEWLEVYGGKAAEYEQTNIITTLTKMDKKLLPGLLQHYKTLSEICHPNVAGHFLFFAHLNRETAVVKLTDGFIKKHQIFRGIIIALISARLCESFMDKVDELIPSVVKLSEASRKEDG